ncbi:3-alpha-hydroxysteroid sulfotransferase-like [Amblyomma americanum]
MDAKKPYFNVVDGIQRCPNLVEQVFRKNLHFKAQEGDVVQCTHVGCGTKWLHYIITLILRRGEPLANVQEFGRCIRSIDHHSDLDQWVPQVLPMRLFITRMPLSRDMMNADAKYVCVARNPWDDGTFQEFFDAFLQESFGLTGYIEAVSAAYALKDESNVFFVTYEDLIRNTGAVVVKLAAFLGEHYGRQLQQDKSLVRNIVEHSSAQSMRHMLAVKAVQKPMTEAVNVRSGYQAVRSAKVGEWSNFFTAEQLRCMEAKIQAASDAACFMHLWDDIRAETIAAAQQS